MNKLVQVHLNKIAAVEKEERRKRHKKEAGYQQTARDKKNRLKPKYQGLPSTSEFPFMTEQQQKAL